MEILNKVIDIISELSGEENITPEQNLQHDFTLDSLHMVLLLIELEERFDIVLEESDMNPFDLNTVEDIVTLVKKYVGGDNNEKTEKEN